MRRAPPVTSAACGTGGVGKPPCRSPGRCGVRRGHGVPCSALGAGAHLGPHHVAGRHAGAAQRSSGRATPLGRGRFGEPEFGLFEPADLVAQPRRLLEFEVGGGGPHALFEIGDDRLQILALVVRRVALAEPDRDVVALVDASRMSAMPCRTLSGVMPLAAL